MDDIDGNNPMPATSPAGPVAQEHEDLNVLFEKISELPSEYVDMVRAMVEVVNEQYPEARRIIKDLPARERAVVIFYAQELIGIADTVQMDEDRY